MRICKNCTGIDGYHKMWCPIPHRPPLYITTSPTTKKADQP